MHQKTLFSIALLSAAVFSSCGKLGQLSKDNFTVTPSPLEAVAGQVPVTINGVFPEKYMKTKAQVTVIPVLRYQGGESVGQAATFQGEKVEANNQTISYKVGGNYTMKTTFPYQPAMEQSELYLTFNAKLGKKVQQIPEVKVAEGVIATYSLVQRTLATANPAVAPDAYQFVVHQKQEANIRFLIQQAQIRSSELKTQSVQDFIKMLRTIKADEQTYALNNIEIAAYASPDGGEKLNKTLSQHREKNTTNYLQQQLKKTGVETAVDARYTAQDWEGFQQLVQASNIQDKEVILRLLSMYKDPEERERQIKNLSAAFTELTNEILPELRRSRIAINYDVIGRSDNEIMALVETEPTKLSLEELLYAAGMLSEDASQQVRIYTFAAKQYPNDYRALNNLAANSYKDGNIEEAASYLNRIPSEKLPAEAAVNMGLIALRKGNITEAETLIAKGGGAKTQNEALGNLAILQGHYTAAATRLQGTKTNSEALAQILDRNYEGAQLTLSGIAQPDYMTAYLQAIAAMRMRQPATAIKELSKAIQLSPEIKSYAARDLEFVTLRNNADFSALLK